MTRRFARRLAVCLVLVVFCAGTAFAQKARKYSSERYGYSLAYPSDWHIVAGDKQIDLSLAEGGFGAEGDNCGFSLAVEKLVAADEATPEKVLKRIAGEGDQALDYGAASTRRIAGREWYAVPYTDTGRGLTGDIWVLVKGAFAFVSGSFYSSGEVRERFQPAVDRILASLSFTPVAYRNYLDKERGIAFRCPKDAEVDDQGDEVRLVLAGGDVTGDGFGAVVSLGSFNAADEEFKNMDEKGVFRHLEELFGEGTEFGEPARAALARADWYRGEAVRAGGKMTIYLRKQGAYFFGVVLIVRPTAAENEYKPMFDAFIKSLSIDFKKWTASLEKAGKK